MNSKLKTILKVALPLLLGVVLVWYSLSKISIGELILHFKKANYFWVALGILFGFLSHLSRAYRWKFLLEPLGYFPKMPNRVMAVFAGYLVNFTIPRAGEVTRATVLTNYEGVPFEKGFGTIVSERVADLLVLLLIILTTLFLEFEFIYNFFIQKFDTVKVLSAGALLLVLGVGLIIYFKNGKSQFAVKVRTFVVGLIEGVLSILKMKKKWAFIGHTLFIWIMYLLMFYVTSLGIEELQPIPLAAILVGFISATFSIAATNGGIGSYPEAVVLAFMLFALPEDPSRAFGWIMWSTQTLMLTLLGGISLICLPIYNRTK
ncbi:lysylphosphatidylglycerol synthase transmembrane domain-containing protein [Mangrovimonas xylaniphaga]|uniref:lysylphosphatidylglycerol synthase transmembrane domain-containing protein n=1 Tax=Mangrovimonas xylaniphaga TaxID=1645915 RepID=UPI0006B4CE31|nr:lysylphosphatidylglycerol synthase transmembrane domain-containing protein [Mangrovimonas xylaniphaga]